MKNTPSGDIINLDIPNKDVLVIDSNGQQLGIMSRNEALSRASESGKDLMLVSSNPKNLVVKIIDYGKHKFEEQKKQKEAKKKQHVIITKEIRLTVNISENDLETKAKKVIEFLQANMRVKVSLKFKGRESKNLIFGENKLNAFFEKVQDYAVKEKPPTLNNQFYDMYLRPKKFNEGENNNEKIETKNKSKDKKSVI